MTVVLNSSGQCDRCQGVVRNPEGKRRAVEQLAAIHAESCPGVLRMKQKEST